VLVGPPEGGPHVRPDRPICPELHIRQREPSPGRITVRLPPPPPTRPAKNAGRATLSGKPAWRRFAT